MEEINCVFFSIHQVLFNFPPYLRVILHIEHTSGTKRLCDRIYIYSIYIVYIHIVYI